MGLRELKKEQTRRLIAETAWRMIAASPALLAREQRAIAGATDSLAGLIAAETGAPADDVQVQVAANALMGVHRALLEHGLGDYAPKPEAPAPIPATHAT